MSNAYQNAVTQLEQVAQVLLKHYQDPVRFRAAVEKLKTPDQVIEGDLEITLDSGDKQTFKAYRSQHNNARGPYKGGIRFHPQVTKDEVMALSTWMTWKSAVTAIPYGGGKGGVVVDPRTLSERELQAVSRAYSRMIAEHIGPWTDVPAPDVNTNGQIMAWMVDEYQSWLREKNLLLENPLATFTGKPLELGGSEGREEATGLGGVYILEKLAEQLGLKRKQDVTIAVQGFGNVGYWFAYHADRLGYKVVAVSDSRGGIYVERGLDPAKTLECKKKFKTISECMCVEGVCDPTQGKVISNEELLELPVDIVVPAALENVIHKDNASRIKAKAIVEMANGPVTPEADQILQANEVVAVPDVLANAGGVTTSYFEWVQNVQGYTWTKEEVLTKLQPLMVKAFDQAWSLKQELHSSLRMATYAIAVKRVIDVMMLRGQV